MSKLRVTVDPQSHARLGVLAVPFLGLLVLNALVFPISVGLCSAAEPATEKNVLLLYSFSDRTVFDSVDSLESAVRARVKGPVNFYVEFLEAQRFESEDYDKSFAETLRHSFSGQNLSLVITAAYPALQFALRHRDEEFPGVPIIFTYMVPGRFAGQNSWPGVTGVTAVVDVKGTIDLALRAHPDTENVAVITNNSEFERFWLAAVHAELRRHGEGITAIDLFDLSAGRLLEKTAGLPPHTIVLFQQIPQDSRQLAIGPYEIVAAVGQRLPTYCIFPKLCLNHGGIGGSDYSEKEQTQITANLASRVLAGERPDDIPVVNGAAHTTRVDWRQLRRWNISESALPPGSVVLYREPTIWERDKNYIIAALVVIGLQFLWIAALLWQRARKRKAEAVLTESEGRFQRMANTTPSLVWMCDRDGKVTYVNDRRIEFTGRDPAAGFEDVWTTYVHPDDVEGVLSANARSLEQREKFSKQYRLRRKDGVYRWMFDVAAPRVNGDGSFAGFIGSAIDITDQKLAQDALENVSGRLIEAQEKERTRIARDLHDDICQRLAMLSMELEGANRTLDNSSEVANERLEQIRQHCAEIAGDVQALSHELHSSKLDYLGVAAGIRGFCNEFAKQHKISIDFNDENVPTHLPKDMSLCLFRVAQEGLHNAVKYSGTTHFTVTLRRTPNEVVLEVRDGGIGFDVEEAKRNRGIGLVSMQERVHLVHGTLFIESAPGKGTRITATVPLVEDGASAVAAGDEPASISGAA